MIFTSSVSPLFKKTNVGAHFQCWQQHRYYDQNSQMKRSYPWVFFLLNHFYIYLVFIIVQNMIWSIKHIISYMYNFTLLGIKPYEGNCEVSLGAELVVFRELWSQFKGGISLNISNSKVDPFPGEEDLKLVAENIKWG